MTETIENKCFNGEGIPPFTRPESTIGEDQELVTQALVVKTAIICVKFIHSNPASLEDAAYRAIFEACRQTGLSGKTLRNQLVDFLELTWPNNGQRLRTWYEQNYKKFDNR